MAGDLAIAEAAQRRHRGLAGIGAARAAAVEAADIRIGIDRAARLAGEPQPRAAIVAEARHRGDQRLRIGMQRMLEHFHRRAGFHDLAEIHHQHAVAQQPHHGEIVRDEQIAHAELFLEPLQELKDDHLNRNVERGGRLVEHQKIGLDRDGAGNADAGALAAGKLMRKARQQLQRQPALGRHLFDAVRERLAAQLAQPAQRIGDGVEAGEARIDAFAGVLEHHLDAGAIAIAGEYARRLQRHFAVAELDAAVAHVDQAGQRAHQGRLAATGFADEADGLALVDGEAYVVDRVHLGQFLRPAGKTPLQPRPRAGPAADRKQFRDVGNVKQNGHAALSAGATIIANAFVTNNEIVAYLASIYKDLYKV